MLIPPMSEIPNSNEVTSLLTHSSDNYTSSNNETTTTTTNDKIHYWYDSLKYSWLGLAVAPAVVIVTLVCYHVGYPKYDSLMKYRNNVDDVVVANMTTTMSSVPSEITTSCHSSSEMMMKFPSNFVWGVATSAYQIEGAVNVDHRGLTIWDTFVQIPGNILDGSTGNIADDHYHRYKEDIQLMHQLNIRAYRFSIAWSRILPTGRFDPNNNSNSNYDNINMAGIQFYHNIIDELLQYNIQPWITLFHWDLPQVLQEEDNNGWMNRSIINDFVEYANIVFQHFSHKVTRFITINEPWTYSVIGHGSGEHAPGRKVHPSTEPYIVAHHMILAHVKVARLYKTQYAGSDGMIGMSNCGDFRYPRIEYNKRDQEAAIRAMLYQWGWFVEPLIFGHYPTVMRERLGDRLPNFTIEEQRDLVGSTDFFGLNYYSSLLASDLEKETTSSDYWSDMHVNLTDDPTWMKNAMGWNVVPGGLHEMLRWISERYNNPLIYITENGSAEPEEEDSQSMVHDEKRRNYLENHIKACANAINKDGINLAGYFAWSFLDNFEWQFGYQRRFGICHVNFTTLERTPRDSALWYRDHIKRQEHDVRHPQVRHHGIRRLLSTSRDVQSPEQRVRPIDLPPKVLIGYGSDCDAVRRAVYDGVNIVMWSFIDVVRIGLASDPSISNQFRTLQMENENLKSIYSISTSFNLSDVKSLIMELYMSGYGDVLHFASVGGWNGAHIDTNLSPSQWYQVFKELDIFDGIDWDLEGNDVLNSPYNFFTVACFNHMGMISQLAKKDGKFVSIAPPQSYMNINSSRFSRYLNLTIPTDMNRPVPYSTFTYYGYNAYAYFVQQYGDWIDLISIQFYESYSDASYHMQYDGYQSSDYLLKYIDVLVSSNESFYVNFTEDLEIRLPAQNVSLPLNKLVFGFGNGWTKSMNEKIVYISSDQINITWQRLRDMSPSLKVPRGFMFWTINAEGVNGIYMAKDLSNILQS